MRHALIWGGVASLFLTAGLLLAMPENNPVAATVKGGGVPFILGQLSEGMQDFLLCLIIFAFFSCGTSIQGAASRLMFSFARDGALPKSSWVASVNDRFRTPVNALISGAVVTILFVLLVFLSPDHNVKILFITYPANTSVLVSLVSFGVSGIYLAFLLAVIASIVAHARGWVPEGAFTLGRWTWAVLVLAAGYLGLMFLNVVVPTGLDSPRAIFNLDWVTLSVIFVVAVIGALYFFTARPDKPVGAHLHDELEATGAERIGPSPVVPAD
jgi:amino acid transporter